MNYSDYRFTLDIQIHQAQVSIPVTLNDTARKLCIGLTDGRKPYYIADGCRAVFSAKKPDGTTIFNDCIIYNNTTIEYEFSKNTTSCEGIVDCEIGLFDADGRELTSPQFIIVVDKKVMRDEEVAMSVSEATTITNMITAEQGRIAAEKARVTAEKSRVTAESARTSAESARAKAENERAASEETRGTAEAERINAENSRVSAEEARVKAEALRVAAEEGRAEAIINAVKEGISEGLAMEIANDLETDDPERALSAAQGVVLKGLFDTFGTGVGIEVVEYEGTGTYGIDSPTVVQFSFMPKFVIVLGNVRQNTGWRNSNGIQLYNYRNNLYMIFPEAKVYSRDWYEITYASSTASAVKTRSLDIRNVIDYDPTVEDVQIDRETNTFYVISTMGDFHQLNYKPKTYYDTSTNDISKYRWIAIG